MYITFLLFFQIFKVYSRLSLLFVSSWPLLSGISLLAASNVNNPNGQVGLPCVMWSAHFFVTHIQMENISSWNGPTIHVCCFMLTCVSTKTFVSQIHICQLSQTKQRKKSSLAKKFVSRVTRQPRYHCIHIYVFIRYKIHHLNICWNRVRS